MNRFVLSFLLCICLFLDIDGAKYKYDVAVVAIFRDEAPYLKEWIDFHEAVGVQYFYLINNLSQDNYAEVLKPYIKKGVVKLIDWPYESADLIGWNAIQCRGYEHVFKMARGKVKWLAIIDPDEFLFPVQEMSLKGFLARFEGFGGVAVNWQIFGTSFVQKIPPHQMLIEALHLKLPENAPMNIHIKSIVRLERVAGCTNPHYVIYQPGFCQVNSDGVGFSGAFAPYVQVNEVRINHYVVRDENYLQTKKMPRAKKWGLDPIEQQERYNSFNQVVDQTILRFAPFMKK